MDEGVDRPDFSTRIARLPAFRSPPAAAEAAEAEEEEEEPPSPVADAPPADADADADARPPEDRRAVLSSDPSSDTRAAFAFSCNFAMELDEADLPPDVRRFSGPGASSSSVSRGEPPGVEDAEDDLLVFTSASRTQDRRRGTPLRLLSDADASSHDRPFTGEPDADERTGDADSEFSDAAQDCCFRRRTLVFRRPEPERDGGSEEPD
jgi:hypothetical protein